ncbi:MAG: beta-Ala-His dipeptidase [Bacillota bacterium]|nr:beta-Ala-His dipeptidase [Bacillota bacterium]
MRKLEGLNPKKVFYYFEELTKIPRCSGNELEVAKYIEGVGKSLGYRTFRDEFHNVVIEKPAQNNHPSRKTIILQAHTDMVCVARDGFDFDFSCMPIPVKVEGDWVATEGTTLGADNGIGAAMMLALLDDQDLMLPAITCLFTATEETGMNGVIGLEKGSVKGDMLINIDSEEEGVLLTSCAGGVNHSSALKVTYDGSAGNLKKIIVSGLRGGHSGMEIVKERANAVKLLARVLGSIEGVRIADIKGGVKMNAIPQVAEAVVHGDVERVAAEMEQVFRNEYFSNDPDIKVTLADVEGELPLLSEKSGNDIIHYLRIAPHGKVGMSKTIHGLVETSLNLAIVQIEDDIFRIEHSVRSSVRSLKYEVADTLKRLITVFGGESRMSDGYPEWQYREESYLREHMKTVWKDMHGKDMTVTAIHAGLECGYLVEKIGDIDMVSIGPDHQDVHTPDERVCISSVERVFSFLIKTLERIQL